MRDPLSVALRLMAPFVRARAGALVGAAALLVAYSAVAVSPALITQRLIDRDLAAGDVSLVVALALAREVVARMLDGARRVLEVAVENEIRIARDLLVRPEKERRGVEVEVRTAVVLVDVPAEADERHRHALVEAHALSLGKIHRHVIFLPFSRSPESTSRSPTDSSSG